MSKAWKSSDRKGWRRIRERILARDGYCCQSCGESEGPMHIDHIVPKRLGGNSRNRLSKRTGSPACFKRVQRTDDVKYIANMWIS